MSEVKIFLNCNGNSIPLLHGTGVKEDVETSTSTITTFDEVINDGTDILPYNLEVSRIRYETRSEYELLKKILTDMLKIPGMVTVKEVIRMPNEEPFVIVKNYDRCIIDGKSYEMKPEERSAENLKWKCGSCDEYTEDLV